MASRTTTNDVYHCKAKCVLYHLLFALYAGAPGDGGISPAQQHLCVFGTLTGTKAVRRATRHAQLKPACNTCKGTTLLSARSVRPVRERIADSR